MVNLSEFVTGADTIEPEGGNPKDGTHEYEISAIRVQKGTKNRPNDAWILVEFRLDTGERYTVWNGLPANPNAPTPKEMDALRRYLRMLVELGVPKDQANTYDTDQMIGWTGVLTLVTTTGKNDGRQYQNIKGGSIFPSSQKAAQHDTVKPQVDPWAPTEQAPQQPPAAATAATANTDGNPFA